MQVDVLRFGRYSTFDAALNGKRDAFVPIANFETTTPPPPLRCFGVMSERIKSVHDVADVTAPVGFASLRNVLVGRNCWIMRDGNFLWGREFHPDYHKFFLENNMIAEAEYRFGENVLDVADPICLVSGYHDFIYGHFLIETLPKILLAADIVRADPRIKVALPIRKAATFIKDIIEAFIPEDRLLIFDDETSVLNCARVIQPTLFGSLKEGFHSIANAYIWKCQMQAVEAGKPSPPHDALMIQRSLHSYTFRKIRNMDEVMRVVERYGIRSFEPAKVDFLQQVSTFANCRIAISEYTSASHNSLFMPFNSRKVVINWCGEVESRIAALRRQFMYYVPPSSGEAVTWSPGMTGTIEYDADINALDQSIGHALEELASGDSAGA